jgi:predicted DNA-binding transcriptional regulator AlpA
MTNPRSKTSPLTHQGRRGSPVDGERKYLTGPQVCARYGISDMSLWRWLRDAAVAFPQPAMRIRDRRFWLESDLIAWERSKLPKRDAAVA